MSLILNELKGHRVSTDDLRSVCDGDVRYAPARSLWFVAMAAGAIIGGTIFFTWSGLLVFFLATGAVLLFGHSLGSHRKFIHNSFTCPLWLEYVLVYLGVQVGLSGPIGLMRAHELRDFAQRLPVCHDYLRHGSGFWKDAWWQIHCELRLANPPRIEIEPRVANDRFYRFLEATWMLQQLPPALLLYALGGWSFVFFGTCARVTAGIFGHWLIGHFAHNQGGMHFEVREAAVQGRNIRLASILTMGECWHNNHHAYPGSAQLGLFAGEWDPGWWMLMLLRKVGLAWDFRLPQDLPARAELLALDGLGASQMASRSRYLPGPARLSTLWRALISGRAAMRLEWPAAWLDRRWMRALVGRGVELHVDRTLDRLILRRGNENYIGLPAVCLALAQRNRPGRWVAALLLVPAFGFESLRQSLVFERAG